MSEKIKVENVTIKIGRKTLTLTPGEAHDLRDILNETFAQPAAPIVIERPIIIERPRYRPAYPYWQSPVWYGSGSSQTLELTCSRSD